MANIKLLTPDVYNLISAGEVVEKPVGAIKELVENGIDAGATRIVIEVENGGFDLISVTDNGCGIREEDIETAFLKHATSKLNSASDLFAVETLGFRGEALPSISAVSRIKMTTRHASAETAVCVSVENSVVLNKTYVSANVGSKIEVRDLFYNTPARKKFLKSPVREAAEITKFVSKLILINPHLEITYILDGEKIYQTKGGGLQEAIFVVYGADCIANCLAISYVSTNNTYRIQGYVGNIDYSKANKTYQTLSVNGRYVKDDAIAGAIMQAYRPYLMQRRYPFYVLNLDLPFDKVDVNAHPQKTEVRFDDAKSVNSAFYHAVNKALKKTALNGIKQIVNFGNYEEKGVIDDTDYFKKEERNGQNLAREAVAQATKDEELRQSFEQYLIEADKEITVENARKKYGFYGEPTKVAQPVLTMTNAEEEQSAANNSPILIEGQDGSEDYFSRSQILGVAFKTYLIVEIDDKIIFIDQHAAHERLLFDKFMSSQTKDMQNLLFPYVFRVKDEESAFIEDNLSNIRSAGIEIEAFGINTYRITAVSTLLADTNMEEFVQYLLSGIEEYKLDDRVLLVEKIAKKACRAAIKAGTTLNEFEIKNILKDIDENKVLQCPHGRPITVVFTKRQLEKMFKRIV